MKHLTFDIFLGFKRVSKMIVEEILEDHAPKDGTQNNDYRNFDLIPMYEENEGWYYGDIRGISECGHGPFCMSWRTYCQKYEKYLENLVMQSMCR